MKLFIQVILCLFALALLANCNDKKVAKRSPIVHDYYGLFKANDTSLGVELTTSTYNNWSDLLDAVDKIVCDDSLPKWTIKSDNEIRSIYFSNSCSSGVPVCLNGNNLIEINNDSLNKYHVYSKPLDSLENLIKRDLSNYGKNPLFNQHPDKLLISISNDIIDIKKLSTTLLKLTNAFERITKKKDVNIILNQRFEFPPPPPMPE